MKNTSLFLLALLVALSPLAQCQATAPAAADKMQAPPSGFRADFLKEWDSLEKKFVGLAEAIPREKYTWRPTPEVRSVSEVFLHVAGGNYSYLEGMGVSLPAGMDRKTYEKSTSDQARITEQLKQSFDRVRETVLQTSDADLEKPAKLYGQPSTVREVLFAMVTHTPEHLGQMIVYARECGVVPPWTAARQARAALPTRTTGESETSVAVVGVVRRYARALVALDHDRMAAILSDPYVLIFKGEVRSHHPNDMRNVRVMERALHTKWRIKITSVAADRVFVEETEDNDAYDLLGVGPRTQEGSYVVRDGKITEITIEGYRHAHGDWRIANQHFATWLASQPGGSDPEILRAGDVVYSAASIQKLLPFLKRYHRDSHHNLGTPN